MIDNVSATAQPYVFDGFHHLKMSADHELFGSEIPPLMGECYVDISLSYLLYYAQKKSGLFFLLGAKDKAYPMALITSSTIYIDGCDALGMA